MSRPIAVVFDIDETLLIPSDAPYKTHIVKPNTYMVKLCNILHRTFHKAPHVFLLTGRHERLRKITEEECIANGIFYEKLIMNQTDNPIQPGHISKVDGIKEILADYEVIAIFDDDDKCCKMYREMGLPVLQVLQ